MLMPIYTPYKKSVATVAFTHSASLEPNATNFTFNSVDIGSATSDRKVVVAGMVSGGGTGTISGCTLDGSAMTENVKPAIDGEGQCAIFEIEVSSGTSATVVLQNTGSKGWGAIAVFALTGAALTATNTTSTTGDTTPNSTITIPAGGVAVGCTTAVFSSGSGTKSATWSGLTERFDASVDSNGSCATACSDAFASTETNRAISCTLNTTPAQATMALCSWGPA